MAAYGWLNVPPAEVPLPRVDLTGAAGHVTAVLAGGCFWCTEAVLKPLEGVIAVRPGYAGGTAETATYKAVCSGLTGHAEVIEVTYDPQWVSYGRLLQVFFSVAHDPTTLNRQGNDIGPQYRSAIFYQSEQERAVAEAYIRQLTEAKVVAGRIVTTLEPLTALYPAEDYHHDYAARNPFQPYIMAVSNPKVAKLKAVFADILADEAARGGD